MATVEQVKKYVQGQIKSLERRRGKDDGSKSDRDWDIEQERISAELNALYRVLFFIEQS